MRLSLATRIFLGYAGVLLTFGAVTVFSIREMHQTRTEIRLLGEGYLPLSQEISAVETYQKNQERDADRLRDEKNPETRRGLTRLMRLYFPVLLSERIARARERAVALREEAPGRERAFLDALVDRLSELDGRYNDYKQALGHALDAVELGEGPGRPPPDFERVSQLDGVLAAQIRRLHGQLDNRIRDRVAATQARERQAGMAIVLLSLAAIGVGVLATAWAARTLRPIRVLMSGVARIQRGDFSARVGQVGTDEISVLSRELDAMVAALRQRDEKLRQQQQALLEAERFGAVGKMAAHMAHEVRNPLSSIGLNIELLQDTVRGAEFATDGERSEAERLLSAISAEVDRLTGVTDDYLAVARKRPPQLRDEDIGVLLEEVVGFSREELRRAGVELNFVPPTSPLRAACDEAQLRQVILNLLRNAREAMPAGGVVTLELEAQDGRVRLRVKDTGPGLTREALERAFEPLFSTKTGGTGLGLPLSRQILESFGGSLSLEETRAGASFLLEMRRA